MSNTQNVLDNMLFPLMEKQILDYSFIKEHRPHIIQFGNYPFLDIIFKDGKWVVFNKYNAKEEYRDLIKKYEKSYYTVPTLISGYTQLFNPVCKELYDLGIASIKKKEYLSKKFDCIYQLYSYYRLGWMTQYQNIRCFKVMWDQSLKQVSLTKIALLEGINEDHFFFPEENFNMYTPTLSEDAYKEYYEYNP